MIDLFNEQLRCWVYRLEYRFRYGEGRLYMAANHCCDMTGCIRMFEAIDPNVVRIETWAGQFPDIHYIRDRHTKEWKAL